MNNWLSTVIELSKFRITFFSTLTTSVGYILAVNQVSLDIVNPISGVLLLASGSAMVNQVQEWKTDAKMKRTQKRPIPTERISAKNALLLAVFFIVLGSLILLFGTNPTAFGLGLLAVFWYNGVYTFLKKITAFAVIPGALIGSIPPSIGWVAGGGSLHDPQIGLLAFFIFIWQVPHFWLLLLMHGKDYKQAGLPSLATVFSKEQLQRLTFIWILATAITCLIIPIVGLIQHELLRYILIGSAFCMIWTASSLLNISAKKPSFGAIFRGINIYALVIMILLTVDKFIKR